MIGWLRGELISRGADGEVLVDVGGVGYRVLVPATVLSSVGELGQTVGLFVHTHVREDAIVLYGFASANERRCFEALLGAHGVGPVLLSPSCRRLQPEALIRAVIDGDLDVLCAVPGVGRKTAARLVLDLKSKLDLPGTTDGRLAARGACFRACRGEGSAPRARVRARRDPTRPTGSSGFRSRGGSAPQRSSRARVRRRPPVSARREVVGAATEASRSAETSTGSTSQSRQRRQSRTGAVHRSVDPLADPAEHAEEARLRPRSLEEFVGQAELTEHLQIVIEAARKRRQAVDHLLFVGPPGLGKTSLAGIVAAEMGVGLRITSGPALVRTGDLAALLTDLQSGDVLFIDEVHRLPRAVEEVLYPAMEDFQLDLLVGKGPTARSIRLDLPRFTLVGATTRTGLLTSPLRDRFGFVARLDLYGPDELQAIVSRSAGILGVPTDERGARRIAERSRGTPRIANRLLRRVRDFVEVRAEGIVTEELATEGLDLFGIDHLGLDKVDRSILDTLCRRFGGRPVGLTTVAQCVGEETDTIEDAYEPFLLQQGLVQRTPKGRVATPRAFAHLGMGSGPVPGSHGCRARSSGAGGVG